MGYISGGIIFRQTEEIVFAAVLIKVDLLHRRYRFFILIFYCHI